MAKTLEEMRVQLERQYATTTAAIVEWLKEVDMKIEAAFKEWEAYPQVWKEEGNVVDNSDKRQSIFVCKWMNQRNKIIKWKNEWMNEWSE